LINNYEVLKQKLAECEKRIKELETENAKLKEENEDLEWSEIEARMGDDF
jgi:cell division protein FtsB